MFILNHKAARRPYPADLANIMSIANAHRSRLWLSTWGEMAQRATPLHDLPGLARGLKIARLCVKDESVRSPLHSFKALGAPLALICQILRLYPSLDATEVLKGKYRDRLTDYTVITATDGNHGRALAAAARDAGCRCVIVLHAKVSQERERAIAQCGAEIVRIAGNYDASVHEAARLAHANRWQVVSDTSYEGYEDIPRDVMQGYGIISAEIVEQTEAHPNQEGAFTHVFLQGGVGGMAAGVASYFWEFHGKSRPRFIVVEPTQADCLLQSAIAGRAAKASGTVDSVMAGLACGDASPLAWQFLERCVDAFMTIEDDEAVEAMRMLANGASGDMPIIAGESGAAGLAALKRLLNHPERCTAVDLTPASTVLIINTEGATAPSVYADLVGEKAADVLARQRSWIAAH